MERKREGDLVALPRGQHGTSDRPLTLHPPTYDRGTGAPQEIAEALVSHKGRGDSHESPASDRGG